MVPKRWKNWTGWILAPQLSLPIQRKWPTVPARTLAANNILHFVFNFSNNFNLFNVSATSCIFSPLNFFLIENDTVLFFQWFWLLILFMNLHLVLSSSTKRTIAYGDNFCNNNTLPGLKWYIISTDSFPVCLFFKFSICVIQSLYPRFLPGKQLLNVVVHLRLVRTPADHHTSGNAHLPIIKMSSQLKCEMYRKQPALVLICWPMLK